MSFEVCFLQSRVFRAEMRLNCKTGANHKKKGFSCFRALREDQKVFGLYVKTKSSVALREN